jgi:hypothetical protein
MEDIITEISKKPITINQYKYGLLDILTRINLWIELIFSYGTLLKDFSYKKIESINNSDFTLEMRTASLGREYKNWKILPTSLHEFGETWTFEELVITSNTGIVEWYCNKLLLSKEEYIKVCENYDIKIIGVFYHRMKIILENIYQIIDFFSGKKINHVDMTFVKKFIIRPNIQIKNKIIYDECIKILDFEKTYDFLFDNYLNLEKATDLSQMILFLIIKNKMYQ